MGRYLSQSIAQTLAATAGLASLPAYPGQLPVFGSGKVALLFKTDAAWRSPISGQARVRVVGGAGLTESSGGSSSFGSLISATGGEAPSGAEGGAGGVGIGGDFQASGGKGGRGLASIGGGGGGGAGSQLGDGGRGGDAVDVIDETSRGKHSGGGGGVGGHAGGTGASWAAAAGGGSPLAAADASVSGYNFQGVAGYSAGAAMVDGLAPPFFQFVGGYGDAANAPGLSGQGGTGELSWSGPINGGTTKGRQGGIGGGGGGSFSSTGYRSLRGGGQGGGQGFGGAGGAGYAHGVVDLIADQVIPITVADGGLVIVEW